MEPTENQVIARNILKLRKSLQWTQRDLAQAVGANQAMVARWESGQTEPRTTTLEKIAQVFNVTAEELKQADLSAKRALQLTQDPELNRLLTEVPDYEPRDRDALKTVLEAISLKNRMRNAFQRA